MSDLQLEDIDITGVEEHPVDTSVKLHGPPGTGKTTQSAARVATLLRDYDYELGDVCWATYRKSLAMDTLKRLAKWDIIDESELDEPHKGATRMIGTTHAVASRCVGDLPDPVEPWMKNDFCERLGIQYWTKEPWDESVGQKLFRVFEWMKTNCHEPWDPEQVRLCPFADDLRENWDGDVSSVWNKWEDYKGQKDIIDFYEMLEAPIKNNEAPTDGILVIDEYHDATPLMAKLCEMWMDEAEVVIVAGDPNQVVNAFDGADPKFFEKLNLPKVLLDKTYRVGEEHWNVATSLLEKAHDAPPVERAKNASLTEYKSPMFGHSSDSGWDVPTPNRPGSPGDIMAKHGEDTLFLARTKMQADGVGKALELAGVPYYSQDKLHGWNRDKVKDMPSLYNALQKIQPFGPEHFEGASGLARYKDAAGNPASVTLEHDEFATLLEYINAKYLVNRRSDVEDLCDEIRQNEMEMTVADLDQHVENEFWARHTAGAASVERLNKNGMSDRNRTALKNALKRNNGPIDPDKLEVGVMTIHASKGKEAQDVVVYDGVSRRVMQSMSSSDRSYNNEWRTWYVALTRASERLHIMRGGWQWTHSVIPDNILDIAGRAKA